MKKEDESLEASLRQLLGVGDEELDTLFRRVRESRTARIRSGPPRRRGQRPLLIWAAAASVAVLVAWHIVRVPRQNMVEITATPESASASHVASTPPTLLIQVVREGDSRVPLRETRARPRGVVSPVVGAEPTGVHAGSPGRLLAESDIILYGAVRDRADALAVEVLELLRGDLPGAADGDRGISVELLAGDANWADGDRLLLFLVHTADPAVFRLTFDHIGDQAPPLFGIFPVAAVRSIGQTGTVSPEQAAEIVREHGAAGIEAVLAQCEPGTVEIRSPATQSALLGYIEAQAAAGRNPRDSLSYVDEAALSDEQQVALRTLRRHLESSRDTEVIPSSID